MCLLCCQDDGKATTTAQRPHNDRVPGPDDHVQRDRQQWQAKVVQSCRWIETKRIRTWHHDETCSRNLGVYWKENTKNMLISGWWLTYPSQKFESVGIMKFPTEWKHKKNVWNHQEHVDDFTLVFIECFLKRKNAKNEPFKIHGLV